MADMITSLIASIGTMLTSLFSTAAAEGATTGIGVLTGGVLAVALLRKVAGRSKKAIGG